MISRFQVFITPYLTTGLLGTFGATFCFLMDASLCQTGNEGSVVCSIVLVHIMCLRLLIAALNEGPCRHSRWWKKMSQPYGLESAKETLITYRVFWKANTIFCSSESQSELILTLHLRCHHSPQTIKNVFLYFTVCESVCNK